MIDVNGSTRKHHTLLQWSDFGEDWSCNGCGQHGTIYPGDLPEDKLPCLSPKARNPELFHPWTHQDLMSSDFGSWRCNACGQSGDDRTHPRDYPCTAPEEKTMKALTDADLDNLDTEEEFLRNYDLKKYPAQAVTSDLVIFTIRNDRLAVLMIQRGGHPEKGKWALPGGFVNVNESTEEAASRELEEETALNLDVTWLEQLKTYSTPGRDPRGCIVSVAYVALVPKANNPTAGDDAHEARFFAVDDVLGGEFELAFDHRQIIEDGLARVRAKLEYEPIAHKFLDDDRFTMSEYRHIFEIILGKTINPSNFRRKTQSVKGLLEPAEGKRASQVEGGRASDLYRAGPIDTIYPPLRLPWD